MQWQREKWQALRKLFKYNRIGRTYVYARLLGIFYFDENLLRGFFRENILYISYQYIDIQL